MWRFWLLSFCLDLTLAKVVPTSLAATAVFYYFFAPSFFFLNPLTITTPHQSCAQCTPSYLSFSQRDLHGNVICMTPHDMSVIKGKCGNNAFKTFFYTNLARMTNSAWYFAATHKHAGIFIPNYEKLHGQCSQPGIYLISSLTPFSQLPKNKIMMWFVQQQKR